MELHELQFARRVQHDAQDGKPLPHRDTVRLLNIVWAEEKRADVAETQLQKYRTDEAEQRLESLLADA